MSHVLDDYYHFGIDDYLVDVEPPRRSAVYEAAAPTPYQRNDGMYYGKCLAAGVFSSSIRWIQVPLDVVKCNMQVAPDKYPGMISGLRFLWTEQGFQGLFKGLGPTAVAYAFQTGTKYGLYEVLKDNISKKVDPDYVANYRGLVYVTAAGTAEAVACVLMCPWEMIKVRVQTAASNNFPSNLAAAAKIMMRDRATYSFPFGALVPLWGRQIPSTIANMYTFENIVQAFYTYILTQPKESYNTQTQLGVTFASGYLAGMVSATISHPMDSLVSLMTTSKYAGQSMRHVVQQVGFWKLAFSGLVPRIFLMGTTISFQWLLYDSFKSLMGLGTTGGKQ